MKVSIHQINYFPWLGYFNKMANSDMFILLDEVQLTDSGTMQRNRILNKNGVPSWITVAFDKKSYLNKKFKDISLNKTVDWQTRQKNFILDTYRNSGSPYFTEVWNKIRPVFEEEYDKLIDVNYAALKIVIEILKIKTNLVFQSSLNYDTSLKKDDLVLALCKSVGADTYLSGNGAKKYMDETKFSNENIVVEYQEFKYPIYKQLYSDEFIPGLSILDLLFNCGIEKTKNLFYNTLR